MAEILQKLGDVALRILYRPLGVDRSRFDDGTLVYQVRQEEEGEELFREERDGVVVHGVLSDRTVDETVYSDSEANIVRIEEKQSS